MLLGSIGIAVSISARQWLKNRRDRKLLNLDVRQELRKMRKPKVKKPSKSQEGTLIGHIGKRPIYIPDWIRHLLLCGTTGSGKTVVLANFIKRALEKGFPLPIIDGKGDLGKGSILDIVKTLNKEYKRKVYVVNLSDPKSSDKYNPFKNATPTMAKDMLINMTDWSEEHYKSNAERYIQRLLYLLEYSRIPFSFNNIIRHLPLEKYKELSKILLENGKISKDEHMENIEIGNTSGKPVQSSLARFSTIAEGELGNIFSDDGIDMSEAIKEGAVILFILNPLTYPELSPAFGRLILIDSKKAIGNLFNSGIERTFFIMDEISSYASPVLIDLINKSRSAGVTCILSTQSLSDLDCAYGEAFKEQIIENCNTFIIMRQNSGVNAEHWANILGTRNTMEITHQLRQDRQDTLSTGYGSAKRVREYLYHPDDIKTLQTGEGIFLSKDTNADSRVNIYKPF